MKLMDLLEVCEAREICCRVPMGRRLRATVRCDARDEAQLDDLLMEYGEHMVTQISVDHMALCVELEVSAEGGMTDMEREQTTLRLPPELMEKLREQAQAMGISVNGLILLLIDRGLRDLQR